MLVAEPPFLYVLEELLAWISSTVKEVEQCQQLKYFPVLVAHNGFVFDYCQNYIGEVYHLIDYFQLTCILPIRYMIVKNM